MSWQNLCKEHLDNSYENKNVSPFDPKLPCLGIYHTGIPKHVIKTFKGISFYNIVNNKQI